VLDGGVAARSTVYYRLVARAAGGAITVFGPIAGTAGRPIRAFALTAVRPNPTSGRTLVEFELPRAARVRLGVFDVQGREVARLADGVHRPGRYQATWSGENGRGATPVGVYFLVYRTPAGNQVRRIVVAR
jgi:hypothetical protein